MNNRITEFAHHTQRMLRDFDYGGSLKEEIKKLSESQTIFEDSIRDIKNLKLEYLCAIDDDKRQELTLRQQNAIESYAALKRVLLETYRDLFNAIKKF